MEQARVFSNPLHAAAAAMQPDTSSDSMIATLVAAEEGDQAQAARRAAEAAQQRAVDEELAAACHEEEVQQLCRQLSAQLSRVPQLLEQSTLERQRSADFSSRLADVQGVPLVPHVIPPHVVPERPPLPEARLRLEARLDMYGLVERQVKGDGNCQFRALSDQLFRTPRLHAFVRECCVEQLRRERLQYETFVPGDYDPYCKAMARSSEWGDHVTLQAAADYFGLRICVLTSYPESCCIEIEPREARSDRCCYLSFWAEVHYNSLYPANDPPGPLPSEKILGSRRLYNLLFGDVGPLP